MDSSSTQEMHMCEICLQHFDKNWKSPRIQLYGHNYCLSCLVWLSLFSLAMFSILFINCYATCRKILRIRNVTSSNILHSVQNGLIMGTVLIIRAIYAVKSLINRYLQRREKIREVNTSVAKDAKTKNRAYLSEGHCFKHDIYVGMRCMDCKVWICAMCGILQHKHCRTLTVEEAYLELKQKLSQKVEAELEERKTSYERLNESLSVLVEEKRSLIDEIKQKEVEIKNREKLMEELKFRKSGEDKFSQKVKQLHSLVEAAAVGSELAKVMNELETFLDIGKNHVANDIKTAPVSKIQGAVSQNVQTLDVKRQELKTQDVKSQDIKSQEVKPQDVKRKDVPTCNVTVQERKTQFVKTQDLQTLDVIAQKMKTQNMNFQYFNIQNPKTQDVQAQGVIAQEVKTEDTKTLETKKEDTETRDVNTLNEKLLDPKIQNDKTQSAKTLEGKTHDPKTQEIMNHIDQLIAKSTSKLPVMQRKSVSEIIH